MKYYIENGPMACWAKEDVACWDNYDGGHDRSWYIVDFSYWSLGETGMYRTNVTEALGSQRRVREFSVIS